MALEVLNDAQSGVGYVGAFERKGNVVWSVGGTTGSPLVMTSDGGRTWRRRKPPPANGLRDVLPLGEKHALVVGESGALFETRDGESWTQIETGTTVCLFSIERAQGQIWISGEDGFLLASADGSAWRKPNLGEHVKALGRIQRLVHVAGTLWMLGFSGRFGFVKKDVLELASAASERAITGIAFSPRGAGVVVGDGGAIFRTTNRGKTWERVASRVDVDLEDVTFHAGRFVVVGAEGTLLVSEDGASFRRVDLGRADHLWCVAGDGAGLLVGGDGGLVLRADEAALAEAKPIAASKTDDAKTEDEPRVATGDVGPALFIGDAILARAGGRVHKLGDSIEAIEGAIAFGRSRDRKNVALAFPDRIEIRAGLSRAAHATMAIAKGSLGEIRTIEVFPSGDRALVASSRGVFVVSERGADPILGGDREVLGACAALSPDGRTIGCGDRDGAHLLFVADGGTFTLAAEVEPASSERFAIFDDTRPSVRLGALALDLGVLKQKRKKTLKLGVSDACITPAADPIDASDTSDDGSRRIEARPGCVVELGGADGSELRRWAL